MCSIIGYMSLNNYDEFKKGFEKTTSRGPDMYREASFSNARLAFERLAIMGVDESGMQPFNHFRQNFYRSCTGLSM